MISIKNLKYVIITNLLLGVILFPNSVNAEFKAGASDPSEYASKCQEYLGISITASDYNRSTSTTQPRTITMKCKGRCKYYVYYANYGELDKLENDTNTKSTNDQDEDADDEVKIKKKTFNDDATWELPVGKEALIVVISLNEKKCKTKNDKGECTEWEYPKKVAKEKICDSNGKNCTWQNVTYCKKDSSGNCTYKNVTCTKGRFNTDDEPTSLDEVELKGNAASLFVQNPNETGVVENLRYKGNANYGQACQKAYNGLYDSTNERKNQKYTITDPSELEVYRRDYYSKVLSYCDLGTFHFNLTTNQIKQISNRLLKVYYERKKFSNDDFRSLEAVQNEINTLKYRIKNNYGRNNIIKNSENLSKELKCNSTSKSVTDKEYLYISEKEIVKAELSTGTVKVCESKCYEHLTVKYDPPAVVKAGLCFQYKVTVKSVTECGISDNFDLGDVGVPTACSPSPICSNDSSRTQAGPNEEFDNCINKCDGGKYSQSCINSCYDEIYKNKKSTNDKVTKSNANKKENVMSLLANTNKKAVIKRLADDEGAEYESYLKKYYNEDNNPNCNTTKIIDYVHNNKTTELQKCAEYFWEAKALYPHGTYNSAGTQWNPDSVITNDGATSETTTNIPMQIGRASPYYLRSVSSTYNLLVSLVVPSSQVGYWKKYNITSNGIKRQYSTRYKCNETCSFTGCSEGNAYTGSGYSVNIKSDLDKLEEALKKCSATTACDKKEETTEYTIEIKNGEGEKIATTSLNSSSGNYAQELDGDNDTQNDIFVARTEDENTTTGILGLCYDKRERPHYQTTITYPGTWINLKTGKREYTKQDTSSYRYKKNYYCTGYDEEEVNKEYWTWAIINKFNDSAKPSNFVPKYNIIANLGKNDSTNTKGFGKYNWAIIFKCFYALGNIIPDPDNPLCEGTTCVPENECSSTNSTKLCNTNIRVINSANIFPAKDGNKITEQKNIAFNWTSAAKDNTISTEVNQRTGYGIDPREYKEKLEAATEANPNAPFSGTADYHVYLSKENIANLKQYTKDNGYLSYQGTFNNKVEGVEGLYYYKSNILHESTYTTTQTNTTLGVNNEK